MQNPANLRVAKEAMALAVQTYRYTNTFPASERYGLSSQMRRAAVSIGSNIAEGCGRQGNAALLAFLHIALGSASELEFQVALAGELEIGPAEPRAELMEQVRRTGRMLSRLIATLRRRSDRRP